MLRGETHCSAVTLRVLAMERVVRAVLLSLAVYAVLRFRASRGSIQAALDRDALIHELQHALTALLVDPGRGPAGGLRRRRGRRGGRAVAAVPLGEYFATVATAVFLPLEVRELAKGVMLTRAGAFTINIAAVMYLLLAKYLFRLRGGRKAYDRERRGEQLSEVERIALGSDPRAGSGAPPEGSTADRDHALAGPDHGVDAKRPVRGSTRLFPRRSRVSSARSPVRS